jgi:mycoredoxin
MLESIVVYGHPNCPGLGPLKGVLTHSKVKFEYIDIHQDDDGAARVRAINDGKETVPTLVFPDGSTLTEPNVGQLRSKLESFGYEVGPLTWLIGNRRPIGYIVAGLLIAVLITVLRSLGVF